MLKMLFAVGTALTLLFGAVGVGAAAAQNSQSGEPLYALKAWGEPLQFMFQAREQVQTQAMNGSAPVAAGQGLQNQIRTQAQQMDNPSGTGTGQQDQDQLRLQTQDRLQTCQTLDPSVMTPGDQICNQSQDRDQIHLQTQDQLKTHQSLDQTVTSSGDQDRDQTQDQIQLQTQDRLHTEDCILDPQGSAAQNQYGGPHKP